MPTGKSTIEVLKEIKKEILSIGKYEEYRSFIPNDKIEKTLNIIDKKIEMMIKPQESEEKMAIDERYFYGAHGIDIEKAKQERIIGRCKDCKHFEYDSVAKVDGVPLIVAHEICSKWGDGCKTQEDGYCFLFEPKSESEDKE